MAWNDIPRTHSFSLGDFHDFDRCVFRFFVNHHLEKKYQLAEGSPAQAIGTLLDLAIKKFHQNNYYDHPLEDILALIKAAETEIREDALKKGKNSFYGTMPPFLTPEVINKAQEIFSNYHQKVAGKYQKMVPTKIMIKTKPFWIYVTNSMQLWGGPDTIELAEDGIPEVIDYKYFPDQEKSLRNLDMDLMPKIYILLTYKELLEMGYHKARFKVKLWLDPLNESLSAFAEKSDGSIGHECEFSASARFRFTPKKGEDIPTLRRGASYEEFDLDQMAGLENFFKDKMDRILRTEELSFCERDFCKACQSSQRDQWVTELRLKGWIKDSPPEETASPDLPF